MNRKITTEETNALFIPAVKFKPSYAISQKSFGISLPLNGELLINELIPLIMKNKYKADIKQIQTYSQKPGLGQRPNEGLHCSFSFHLILPKENLKVCKYFINTIISDISNAKQDCANKSAGYSFISNLHFFRTGSLQSIFSITLKLYYPL